MAYEPGGYADKLGNRYEGRWVVNQLLRLLAEKLRSVTLEAIGDDGAGVDLVIENEDGTKIYQQCKARNASKQDWTVADLNTIGILANIKYQLDRNPNNQFHLVTGVPATNLGDICESARNSNRNPEDFYKYQIKNIGKQRDDIFKKFCEYMEIDHTTVEGRAAAFDYLNRTYIILYPDDHNTKQTLADFTELLINGNSDTVIAGLADFTQNNIRNELTVSSVRGYIKQSDFQLRNLPVDDRFAPAVAKLQELFEDSIRPGLISGKLIRRQETQNIMDSLSDNDLIILHGTAGSGKSGVLYELIQNLKQKEIPYIPIRLDRQEPKHTTRQFGIDIGLPESPAICLNFLANNKQGVLVIDQLDALRWTTAHSRNSLDVCKDLVKEILSTYNINSQLKVILSCRTFDLENDQEIKNWLSDKQASYVNHKKIEVTGLSEQTIKDVLKDFGIKYNALSNRQKSILASPLHLSLLACIHEGLKVSDFQSGTGLMKLFWKNKRQQIERSGILAPDINAALDKLVDYTEKEGRISCPERLLHDNQIVKTELHTHGIIRTDNGKILFCHQSYLDFLVADRLISNIFDNNNDILQWLGTKEKQSLFRREQLRQVLQLLQDESPDMFFDNVKKLLGSDIRFHLKHLVLEFIGQLETPSQALFNYLLDLQNDDFWSEHIKQTVFSGNPVYAKMLIKEGIAALWLNSGEQKKQNYVIILFMQVSEKIPDEVTGCIEPYLGKGEQFQSEMIKCLCRDVTKDSERMFELRLKLAKRGHFFDYVDWKELSQHNSLWCLRLIEAVVSTWQINTLKDHTSSSYWNSSHFDHWSSDDYNAIKDAAIKNSSQTWELFVPHILRLTECNAQQDEYMLGLWLDEPVHGNIETRKNILHCITDFVSEAGIVLAREQTNYFLDSISKICVFDSPAIERILTKSLAHLPITHSDIAIQYLLADRSRFSDEFAYERSEWELAAEIIKVHSPHCSIWFFEKLENAIISYHSPYEREMAKEHLDYFKSSNSTRIFWGSFQYFLLPALCPQRRSESTNQLIHVLNRKIETYPKARFIRKATCAGDWVTSTLPQDRLDKLSNKTWLNIITNQKMLSPNHNWIFRQLTADCIAESTIRLFADDLRTISKRYPSRFAKLALQLPSGIHSDYLNAILEGLKSTKPEKETDPFEPADISLIEQIFDNFNLDCNNREVAISYCRLIAERAGENWSEKSIHWLCEYATKHPDPKYIICEGVSDNKLTIRDLHTDAVNCVRGVAAMAIGRLLWEHPSLFSTLKNTLECLVNDTHLAVRVAAIGACLPVLKIDKHFAVVQFMKAIENDIRIAACRNSVYYFNCGMYIEKYRPKLSEIILNMVNSEYDEVVCKGAEELYARHLFYGIFDNEVEQCLAKGSIHQRKGIASVASDLFYKKDHTEKCCNALMSLFDDSESAVREITRKVFHNPYLLEVKDVTNFLDRFLESKAFADEPTYLIDTFEKYAGSLVPFADILFKICEAFAGPLLATIKDHRSRSSYRVSEMPTLILRLYDQSKENPEIMNKCLDIWDLFFEKQIGYTRDLTKAIEQ